MTLEKDIKLGNYEVNKIVRTLVNLELDSSRLQNPTDEQIDTLEWIK